MHRGPRMRRRAPCPRAPVVSRCATEGSITRDIAFSVQRKIGPAQPVGHPSRHPVCISHNNYIQVGEALRRAEQCIAHNAAHGIDRVGLSRQSVEQGDKSRMCRRPIVR